jgi:hypothetical protein
MNKIFVIAKREYFAAVRSKAFVVLLVLNRKTRRSHILFHRRSLSILLALRMLLI